MSTGSMTEGRIIETNIPARLDRLPMIAGTYILSGALLVVTAFLFKADVWTAQTQTAAWCVIFFFASAGASSAYLTVSEIFPMETRAPAIAFFWARPQSARRPRELPPLGPGRFRHALATATARGEIRRSGCGRFVLEEEALAGSRGAPG